MAATVILPKGSKTEESDPFTLGEGEAARLVLTGGNIDLVGIVHIEIEVGTDEWSAVVKMTAPDWRAIDLTGPGTFRARREGHMVQARYPLGVVRITA